MFVFFSKLLRIGFGGPAYGQGREVLEQCFCSRLDDHGITHKGNCRDADHDG